MKFGAQLENDLVKEWAEGYVNYKQLKKVLAELVKSGKSQEFSENSVYAAISVATSDDVLKPPGPSELEFMALVDAEIAKVNAFSERLRVELEAQVDRVRKDHDTWVASGSDEGQRERLQAEVTSCEESLLRFEKYINLNYMAFSKILKKHDKVSTCPFRMPYLLKIQSETFTNDKMTHAIKGISDLSASLAGAAVSQGAGAFDPNQAGGASFVRKTSKYWVQTKDVLKVKMYLLKHLPIYKFTDGPTDGDLVSSVYFDNDASRLLYEGRLKKYDGAIALRIRWYGKEDSLRTVYVERKTHREDWWGDGDASAKERFPLAEDQVMPFLQGRLSPDDVGAQLRAAHFRGDVEEAVTLAREIQTAVHQLGLRPAMRTHYMRTAFQRTGDAQVRCSLDTELCMALEPCEAHQWRRQGPLNSLRQVTQFPHSVLEIKLQLATGTVAPDWVTDLLNSGYLREVPKFSKFVHGTAYLNQGGRRPVTELPYWWAPDWKPLWNFGEKTRPLPGNMQTVQTEADFVQDTEDAPSWYRHSPKSGSFVNGTFPPIAAEPRSSAFLQPALSDAKRHAQRVFLAIITCNNKPLLEDRKLNGHAEPNGLNGHAPNGLNGHAPNGLNGHAPNGLNGHAHLNGNAAHGLEDGSATSLEHRGAATAGAGSP
eukprot:Transcript_8248.p1 GENE.Transcript_8248~~Transcript_8248.p1  ORF type:complete len:654 (-),score=272.56 Transcript_8248:1137-3098(-)